MIRYEGVPIHTFASDLDGTLLTADHRLTARTIAALRRLRAAGVRVLLASGRSGASVKPYMDAVGADCPCIASNGAQLVNPDGSILMEKWIDPPLLAEVIRWLRARDVYTQLYDPEHFVHDRESVYADRYRRSSGLTDRLVPDLTAPDVCRASKLLGIAEPDAVARLLPEARERFRGRLAVTVSEPQFLEIARVDATKGQALAELGQLLGFEREGVIAAGDSGNDLSMIQWAGVGVAVDNARDEVKAAARAVCGHGQRDGVAAFLEALLEGGCAA